MAQRIIRFKLSKTLYVRDHVILYCPKCDNDLKKLKYLPRPTSKVLNQFCKTCKCTVFALIMDHLQEVGSLDDGVERTKISVQDLDEY